MGKSDLYKAFPLSRSVYPCSLIKSSRNCTKPCNPQNNIVSQISPQIAYYQHPEGSVRIHPVHALKGKKFPENGSEDPDCKTELSTKELRKPQGLPLAEGTCFSGACIPFFLLVRRTAIIRDSTTSEEYKHRKKRSVFPAARRKAWFSKIVL